MAGHVSLFAHGAFQPISPRIPRLRMEALELGFGRPFISGFGGEMRWQAMRMCCPGSVISVVIAR